MKIRLKEKYSEEKVIESLELYAEKVFDGDDYERGSVESARKTADNAVVALGRLLDVLYMTKTISAHEAIYIINGRHSYEISGEE